MIYTWNSKLNSFESHITCVEIPCNKILYTQKQVDDMFKDLGKNQVIKDVDGVPTIVDLYTENELEIADKRKRITELKALLKATDYQAIKYAEGEMTIEEYSPIKEQRKGWRDEINKIEKLITTK